jgi:hypothetical protein
VDPITQRFLEWFARYAILRLTWRLPSWALVIIIIGAYLLLRTAHGAEYHVFQNRNQTFVFSSDGYRAQQFTTPNGVTTGSNSFGSSWQVYPRPVPPATITPLIPENAE